MKKIIGLRAKTYSYLQDNNDEDKKAKCAKKSVIKRKLKFEDYKNCLEAAQIENKIDVDSLKEDLNQLIKNNKLILKIQERFRSGKHNVFIEEINKIALSSNDDKRKKNENSIETHPYRINKNLVCKEEEIKCNNIIKHYKNV